MEALKAFVGSKKFLAAVAGILAAAGVQFLGLDEAKADEISRLIAGIVGAYVVGQGLADAGKEKAKAENGGYAVEIALGIGGRLLLTVAAEGVWVFSRG